MNSKLQYYLAVYSLVGMKEKDIVEKALWYYRSKLTNSGDGKHHYDDKDWKDSSVGEEAIELAKTAKKFKDTNGGNVTAFNVEWKNVGEVTVSYDAEDVNNSFYVVGPFSLKYDNSVNTKNATLELYTNKDVSGIDFKGGLQERFGIIHCDSQGKIVSGYDKLNKDFPESDEIFYIKLMHTETDAENIEKENFLAVPRVISNIKVKVRKEVPKVDVVYYENKGIRKYYKVNKLPDGIGMSGFMAMAGLSGALPAVPAEAPSASSAAQSIPSNSKKCVYCGADVTGKKFCTECGGQVGS